MTDTEIIKALECCLLNNEQHNERCEECPLYETYDVICQNLLACDALDLIKRQKAETERLTSLCTAKDVIISSQEADIERLNKILEAYALQYGTANDQIAKRTDRR